MEGCFSVGRRVASLTLRLTTARNVTITKFPFLGFLCEAVPVTGKITLPGKYE